MKRDAYIDNYKACLIILVVLTHFTGVLSERSDFFTTFQLFNNFFYMPAFIFLSGYLSKHSDTTKLIKNLVVPYLFFQLLNILVDSFITLRSDSVSFLYPKFTLWYLLSLFFWRISVKYISRFKGCIFIMIAVSLLAGYDNNIDEFLSLSRTIYFYPFFLAGYLIKDISIIKNKKSCFTEALSLIILVIMFGILYILQDKSLLNDNLTDNIKNLLMGSHSYQELKMLNWGWLNRGVCYLISAGMIILIAMLIPRRKLIFTEIGRNTMSIYGFHGMIYQLLNYRFHVYDYIHSISDYAILLIAILILVFILAGNPFKWISKKVASIPIEKIRKEEIVEC